MASNPHSDFTTHIRTLPTLSNLQLSPHKSESTSKTLIFDPPPLSVRPLSCLRAAHSRGGLDFIWVTCLSSSAVDRTTPAPTSALLEIERLGLPPNPTFL